MHLAQVQRDGRVAAAMIGDDVAQHLRERQRRREADAQHADLAACDPLQFLGQRLRDRQHLACPRQQRVTCVGERHRAPRAHEQLHAQLLLQRADLLAQRRLGDVQPQRRASEVQFLGDGHEVTQVAQLH